MEKNPGYFTMRKMQKELDWKSTSPECIINKTKITNANKDVRKK